MQDQDPKNHFHDSHSSIPPDHDGQYAVPNYDALSPPPISNEQYAVAPAFPETPSPHRTQRGTEGIHEEPAVEQASASSLPSTSSQPPASSVYDSPTPAPDQPRPWFEQSPYSYDSSSSQTATAPPQGGVFARKSRRFWLALGAIALLLVALPILLFQGYSYLNRPTPMKTLDTFCNALVQENYPVAYEQFAPGLQLRLPRSRFIVLLAQDRVVSCTHGNADEGSPTARVNLKLVHNSQGINNDVVVLRKGEDNQWKISDVMRAK